MTVLDVEWPDLLTSDAWAAQMATTDRVFDSRVEVIDPDDVPLADIRPDSAEVVFEGDSSERWEATLQLIGDYPVDTDDMLHPLTGNRIRLWWREWLPQLGGWGEVPCMTGWPEDPGARKGPGVTTTLKVLDALTRIKRGGYGGQTLEVGGLTVDAALTALFGVVAPWVECRFPETGVVLPPTYTLGAADDVEDDWVRIATVAGWVVWSDRMGVVVAGPVPAGGDAVVDWQEGPGCRVVDLQVEVKTSGIRNAWVAKSSSSEVVPPIVGRKTDDDEGSPTWVGRYGPFWGTVSLDSIATQEAADNAAAAALSESRRPVQTVTVTVPPRPDFEYGDVIDMASPDVGVVGPYTVESWRIQMPGAGQAPVHMTVVMVARSVEL